MAIEHPTCPQSDPATVFRVDSVGSGATGVLVRVTETASGEAIRTAMTRLQNLPSASGTEVPFSRVDETGSLLVRASVGSAHVEVLALGYERPAPLPVDLESGKVAYVTAALARKAVCRSALE